jgi:sulfonate transport system ATP-binding protein
MVGIDLHRVSKNYIMQSKVVNALLETTLFIKDATFVTVVGRSGCGKTTLLRLIQGLEPVSSGTLSFMRNGQTRPLEEIRIGIMFQEPRLMSWLTVERNVAFSLGRWRQDRTRREHVDTLISTLGLESFREAYPYQISGGMAQRTALGRTLCDAPEVILMDEPFGALDAFTRRNLQEALVNIFLLGGKTILFVTHDVDEAVLLGQRVLIMEKGQVIDDLNINLPYPRETRSFEFYEIREAILSRIFGNE